MKHRLALALLPIFLTAQKPGDPVDIGVEAHTLKPQKVDPAPAALKLPPGFRIDVFATGLGKPRIIAVTPDGSVYVTRRDPGDCLLLKDTNNDGRADGPPKTVATQKDLHGIAIKGNQVWLTSIKEVFTATRNPNDGTLSPLKPIVRDLPDGGQHPNRTLAIGPDGMLYITVGSTCNECTETSPESATILRAKPDGTARTIYSSGLRNTIGFDWHPETKQLWGFDHGIDWLGDNEQGEELNLLIPGAKYGWPYVYADSKFNLQDEPPNKQTWDEWARASKTPARLYTAHAAPMQFVFYTGNQFPPEFRNDAFVTMRGSWNRKPPSGYEVVRVHFENGNPVSIEPFLTGFLTQDGAKWSFSGRPVGLAQLPDGSLLVGDDTNGTIYRITYSRQP